MAKNIKALMRDADKRAAEALTRQMEQAIDLLDKAKTAEQVDAQMTRIEKLKEQSKPYIKTARRKSK